ncbi:hypothetical protein Pcinc_023081 [Petrolisthes cinctipes]|uniref:Uncharacterized protein n=1 Tax=Petrolisthes cinctipes TaxID=88211 RepID=A0AAE1KEY6_PETCI|nr:hypothetical protein Pcinc_023081 [Petrolisthes cinctipes]
MGTGQVAALVTEARPFDVDLEDLSDEESSIQKLQEELIEVQHDETLRFNFQQQSLGVFRTAEKEKPVLGREAEKVLLQFATTYLCESGFASLAAIKTKSRNRLQPEHDLRVALSTIEPRMDKFTSKFQPQGSH